MAADDLEVTIDLITGAMRLATDIANYQVAQELIVQAESLASTSTLQRHKAVASHCRGLLESEPGHLRAAAHYAAASLPLSQAQALEAAGAALAERGDVVGGRSHFTSAYAIYTDLGAKWGLTRTQARLRSYGIRRGPRTRKRRPRSDGAAAPPAR